MSNHRRSAVFRLKEAVPVPVKRYVGWTVRRATARWRVDPSWVVIGTMKAGTTSMRNYLRQHPDVIDGWKKEVRFFDDNFERGVDWYRSHFPLKLTVELRDLLTSRRPVCGEASPNYIWTPSCPGRLAATVPDAKLIVLLRDPVERSYSHYQHMRRKGRETRTFADAVAQEFEHIRDPSQPLHSGVPREFAERHFQYVRHGVYADQLERWLTLFPREQLLILKSEELFAAPRTAFRRVTEFLGLVDSPSVVFDQANAGNYTTAIPAALRGELERYYRPHNLRLEAVTGVRFAWSDSYQATV